MKEDYVINNETVVVMSVGLSCCKVFENDESFEVNMSLKDIIELSCNYFGSSFNGRVIGSKNILGSVYKIPVIVEETQKLIFFPTEALASDNVGWISYKNIKNVEKHNRKSKVIFNNGNSVIIDCPFFSIKNQIFRCNMLEAISNNRKNGKKND